MKKKYRRKELLLAIQLLEKKDEQIESLHTKLLESKATLVEVYDAVMFDMIEANPNACHSGVENGKKYVSTDLGRTKYFEDSKLYDAFFRVHPMYSKPKKAVEEAPTNFSESTKGRIKTFIPLDEVAFINDQFSKVPSVADAVKDRILKNGKTKEEIIGFIYEDGQLKEPIKRNSDGTVSKATEAEEKMTDSSVAFSGRFMPNVKFEIPQDIHFGNLPSKLRGKLFGYTSKNGNYFKTTCNADLYYDLPCDVVSIYLFFPELVPKGMVYYPKEDKLIPKVCENQLCGGEMCDCPNEISFESYQEWEEFIKNIADKIASSLNKLVCISPVLDFKVGDTAVINSSVGSCTMLSFNGHTYGFPTTHLNKYFELKNV